MYYPDAPKWMTSFFIWSTTIKAQRVPTTRRRLTSRTLGGVKFLAVEHKSDKNNNACSVFSLPGSDPNHISKRPEYLAVWSSYFANDRSIQWVQNSQIQLLQWQILTGKIISSIPSFECEINNWLQQNADYFMMSNRLTNNNNYNELSEDEVRDRSKRIIADIIFVNGPIPLQLHPTRLRVGKFFHLQ